jgi:hypothetical protein
LTIKSLSLYPVSWKEEELTKAMNYIWFVLVICLMEHVLDESEASSRARKWRETPSSSTAAFLMAHAAGAGRSSVAREREPAKKN